MIAQMRTLIGSIVGVVAGAIAVLPDESAAQRTKPPYLVEEPFIGNLAFTQERGEIQISSLMRVAGSSANRTGRIPLEIEYGITDAIELSIETGGANFARPDGWSSPNEFGLGIRYGRYGLLPNLHASVTIEAESEKDDDGHLISTTSGVQLGLDIPRLRMAHLFTNVVAGIWNSERTQAKVDWTAGVIVPFGRLRAVIERPLTVSDPASRGTVFGLVLKAIDGLDIGVASTLRTQPSLLAGGVMLSVLVEF